MNLAYQINMIIEQLPETEQRLIFELVKRISPDDILSAEDIADIEEARAEYEKGDTISGSIFGW